MAYGFAQIKGFKLLPARRMEELFAKGREREFPELSGKKLDKLSVSDYPRVVSFLFREAEEEGRSNGPLFLRFCWEFPEKIESFRENCKSFWTLLGARNGRGGSRPLKTLRNGRGGLKVMKAKLLMLLGAGVLLGGEAVLAMENAGAYDEAGPSAKSVARGAVQRTAPAPSSRVRGGVIFASSRPQKL